MYYYGGRNTIPVTIDQEKLSICVKDTLSASSFLDVVLFNFINRHLLAYTRATSYNVHKGVRLRKNTNNASAILASGMMANNYYILFQAPMA